MPRTLWEPTAKVIEKANITAYSRWLEGRVDIVPTTYADLWRWSVEELEDFWESVWGYFGVRSETPHATALESRTMPGARWFPGSSVNYAEHIFAGRDSAKTAVVSKTEQSELANVTWNDLQRKVGAFAESLKAMGIGKGDRVAAYLPNAPETVISFLACASIGAVWSSCAPDFGTQSAVDRFKQIGPRALIGSYGYTYR